MKIEIDNEVFNFLQTQASPFVDTPNSVLRRLLLGEKNIKKNLARTVHDSVSSVLGQFINITDKFVKSILKKEFKEVFQRKDRFQYMFESDNYLVYFQNFNKENDKLWYRITEKPLGILRTSSKTVIICFTNPAMKIAYSIPLTDIEERVKSVGWKRNYLEVNIDSSSRWLELHWNIEEYLKEYNQ